MTRRLRKPPFLEATLFASELRETYEKTAKAMKWECEIMSESIADLGGVKETLLSTRLLRG